MNTLYGILDLVRYANKREAPDIVLAIPRDYSFTEALRQAYDAGQLCGLLQIEKDGEEWVEEVGIELSNTVALDLEFWFNQGYKAGVEATTERGEPL